MKDLFPKGCPMRTPASAIPRHEEISKSVTDHASTESSTGQDEDEDDTEVVPVVVVVVHLGNIDECVLPVVAIFIRFEMHRLDIIDNDDDVLSLDERIILLLLLLLLPLLLFDLRSDTVCGRYIICEQFNNHQFLDPFITASSGNNSYSKNRFF